MKAFIPAVSMLIVLLTAFLTRAQNPPSGPNDLEALKNDIRELRELLARQDEYEARLEQLEKRLQELESSRAVAAKEKPRQEVESAAELEALIAKRQPESALQPEPFASGLGGGIQSFNPDVSVNADFLFHHDSREEAEPDDEFLFRELEIGLSGYVDPYARSDVFLGIHKQHEHHENHEEDHEEHVGAYELHVEEAYLTLLTLPWDVQAKIGKFKASFGKVNPQHLHALPWVEYPLVVRNYFGHEGLAGEGASISWLVPNPWDNYIELTYEIFNNDDPHLFAGEAADDFVHLVHLKNFLDLSDSSTFEVGLSGATAPNDAGHGANRTWVGGVDLTYKWCPLGKGLYESFMWQTEVMAAGKDIEDGREDSWGLFSALEYQFAQRWSAGVRYDFSELPDDSSLRENAYSAYLTFFQSEYTYWRLGYQYSDRNFDVGGDEYDHQFFLQLNFDFGSHGTHDY